MTKERITTIKARDMRIGEHIRKGGLDLLVTGMVIRENEVIAYNAESPKIFDADADVEVVGKRGRKVVGSIHFNPYTPAGNTTVRFEDISWRGSHRCGATRGKLYAFASTPELVTCEGCKAHAETNLRKYGPREDIFNEYAKAERVVDIESAL